MTRAILLAMTAGLALNAQPAFEAAAVKPSTAGPSEQIDPGRLLLSGFTLRQLLQDAYSVSDFQISGGPAWLNSDRFEVQATASGSNSRAQLLEMLQPLLAHRFTLKLHRETRDLSGYALEAEKKLKLEPSTAAEGRMYVAPLTNGGVNVHFKRVAMPRLAAYISLLMNCPVVDRTGLTGSFDFEKEVALDVPFDMRTEFLDLAPALGLKLEPVKVPTEILVIDSAERPSEN